MDPTGQQCPPSVPSTDPLPDQTDIIPLLERVFVDYIRTGGAGLAGGSEPGRLVAEMANRAGSEYKDSFEECYSTLEGNGLTTGELVARCVFDDGRCNWGRVVTALAFSRLVAERLHVADAGEDGGFLDDFSASVGKSLAGFVGEWTSREGQDSVVLQTTKSSARVSSSNRWTTADAFVSCFGAFVKVGAFAVTYANDAIR